MKIIDERKKSVIEGVLQRDEVIFFSYFYNYKPSQRILRQHRVLRNLRKNKDIVITKANIGNGVVITLR